MNKNDLHNKYEHTNLSHVVQRCFFCTDGDMAPNDGTDDENAENNDATDEEDEDDEGILSYSNRCL